MATGKIEAGALLPKVAGREVDDDATQRPFEPRALDGRTDPIGRIPHRGAGEPREGERRQPAADVGLDGDEVAAHTEHRHPEHPSVHASTVGRGARRSVTAVTGGPDRAAVTLAAMVDRFDWSPEPDLLDIRDPGRSRPSLEALGEATWREALDWLYDHAMERARAWPGLPGGPRDLLRTQPSAGRGADVPDDLATRSWPSSARGWRRTPTTPSIRARSATSRLPRCRCRSPARCCRSGSTKGSTSGTQGRSAPSSRKRSPGGSATSSGSARTAGGS